MRRLSLLLMYSLLINFLSVADVAGHERGASLTGVELGDYDDPYEGETGGAGGITVTYEQLQASYDLDVAFIERTPRYPSYCIQRVGCPGQPWCNQVESLPIGGGCEPTVNTAECTALINGKRHPAVGEIVTYRAHILNKGGLTSSYYGYTWRENGVIVTDPGGNGFMPPLAPGQKHYVTLERTWNVTPGTIELMLSPVFADVFAINNARLIHTHGLALTYFVNQQIADSQFTTRQSALTGTFSFEDWIQAHITQVNDLFAQSRYAVVASDGILDRIRIDQIIVYSGSIGPALDANPYTPCEDGRWHTTEGSNYTGALLDRIDGGLIHELGHAVMSLPDGYSHNLPGLLPNAGVSVLGADGNPIPVNVSQCAPPPRSRPPICPIIFEGVPGVMGGSDTYPHNELKFWERHVAAAMNRDYLKRRGDYGRGPTSIHLWDTPETNYLRVLNDQGQPITSARVRLLQKAALAPNREKIDDIPEITCTTDANGIMRLTNRSVGGPYVSANGGHTLRANPFGAPDNNAVNGTMMVHITKGQDEWIRWLTIQDLNLAYWMGNEDVAVHTVGPCTIGADAEGDEVRDACDNCPNIYNPTLSDRDHDGIGDNCDPFPDLNTSAGTQCVMVNPTADVYVTTVAPTTNYGSSNVLQVGRGASGKGGSTPTLERTFVAFNLTTSLPSNATVTKGVFHAFNASTFGYPADDLPNAHFWRNTGSFNEMTVTFNSGQPSNTVPPNPKTSACG